MRSVALAALLSVTALCSPTLVLGGETVLLDFSASWCGPCQSMEPTIHRLAQEGLPVRKVDFDQQRALANRYSVSSVPTFIMLVDGKEVDRVVGAVGYSRLKQMFDRARVLPPGLGNVRSRGQSPDLRNTTSDPRNAAPDPSSRLANPRSPISKPPAELASLPPASRGFASLGTAAGVDPLIQSTVRIQVEDATGHSFGTGTIIDARSGEALVVTCGHLFRDSKGKGPISVELFTSGQPRSVPGNLIEYDLDDDLALLSIRVHEKVRAATIAGAGYAVSRGQSVTSVGCNNGQDPTVRRTQVTQVDRYAGPPNIEAAGAPVQGRSGGGLFDSVGRLIGVCYAADEQDNEGLYRAVASIHSMLDRHGLSEIYRQVAPTPSGNLSSETRSVVAGHNQPVPRSNRLEDSTTSRTMPGRMPQKMPGAPTSGSSSSFAAASPDRSGMASLQDSAARDRLSRAQPVASLSEVEAAALSEIGSRSQNAEVICIIRPKDPSIKSEVIVLDNASSQFIERLSAASRRASPQLTSMQVPQEIMPARRVASETARRDAEGWESTPRRR